MKQGSKKFKVKSEASIDRTNKSGMLKEEKEECNPLDILTVKIISLRLADNDPRYYAIKVTFFDQLILSGIIKPIGARDVDGEKTVLAKGTMNYDPSDYEKICLFPNYPLIVNIQPLRNFEDNNNLDFQQLNMNIQSSTVGYASKTVSDISCCNVDILQMFIDTDEMCVRVRMQPSIAPLSLYSKSWDNLPLLTMKLSVQRHEENSRHHEILKTANYIKMTLVGAYNMTVPYDEETVYTGASKSPRYFPEYPDSSLITFCNGAGLPRNFNSTNFYPSWECIRESDDTFTQSDEKLSLEMSEIQNDCQIDLEQYMTDTPIYSANTVIWGSFHRTLILGRAEKLFWKSIRNRNWPFEVHSSSRYGGQSYMAFLQLFQLLYPGVNKICIAAPLHWINSNIMMEKCGCEFLLTPFIDKSFTPAANKGSKLMTESTVASNSTDTGLIRPTGADDSCAFIIVEVKLARPLVKQSIPELISRSEIQEMLLDMEQGPSKRECTGRGQLDREWQSTVRNAAGSLRKVPHHGLTEFCIFYRQLSETRTRVEISTSFWLDAAVYVNNNFVVQEYLESNAKFEELVVMSHACLMKIAYDTLSVVDNRTGTDYTLKAARHARQVQDLPHATDLYFQVASEKPYDANIWRELATCLKDVDRDWAEVCIDKAFELNTRHPLTLLIKGCMVFDVDPDAAEPFFMTILALYPYWGTAWIITSVYFLEREMFRMADMIIEGFRKTEEEAKVRDKSGGRVWERELGDWWEPTPLLPGMGPYYDAADLLLRIRAMNLAEACLAVSLTENGETAAYFHLVALCHHLREDIDSSLCLIQTGIAKYGEVKFLRSLEAECYHKKHDTEAALASFEKSGTSTNAYSVLLSLVNCEQSRKCSIIVDLIRRQPSAYAWMALADYWMQRATTAETVTAPNETEDPTPAFVCAEACAVRALKIDRRAGRAWALLADIVRPVERRNFCIKMAATCGYHWPSESHAEVPVTSTKSHISYHKAIALRKCMCDMCDHIVV